MKKKNNFLVFLNLLLVLTFALGYGSAALVGTYTGSIESSPSDDGTINFASPYTYCGDGVLNLNKAEQCDRSDLGGATCDYVGYELGSVTCQNLESPEGQTPGLCVLDFTRCYNESTTTDTKTDTTTTTTSSGGGGGSSGGGGGGSATTTSSCTIDWSCEEWGKCDNGTQTRVCVDLNACDSDLLKPSVERSCINEGVSGDEATFEGYEPGFFRTTGAVITDSFGAEGKYLGWMVVIIVLSGLYFIFFGKRKEKSEFPEHPKNNKIKGK